MPRLIDADALKEYIGCADAVKYGNKTAEQQHNSYSTIMMYEVADYIDDMPTIDAEPVRHGRWIRMDDTFARWKCSECGAIESHSGWEYCHCGAKMDGGAEE